MEDTLQDALKSQPSLLPRWKQDYRATLHYVIQMMVHVILSYPRARAMPRTYACTCTRFVSFPDPPQKVERGYVWCSERQLLSQRAGPYFVKNVIIAFLYMGTRVSDASVHMDYYPVQFSKAQDSRKVYWDSRKQSARQVFTISDLFQNTIDYVMQS